MQISSKNKTILVLSDVHQQIDKLEYIIKKESPDIIVHLGDFFDSHYLDTKEAVEKTCLFIKNNIFRKNFYTLLGNHDIHYLYKNNDLICSGYKEWKCKLISEIFGDKLKHIADKHRWYFWIDDFLCTHGGIHEYHLPPFIELNKPSFNDWLNAQCKSAKIALSINTKHWFYMAGAARFGDAAIGGLLWLDFEREFEPIEGLKQLVGHTYKKSIRPHHSDGNLNPNEWNNICVDCCLSEYLLITNGIIQIKSYADL